MRSVLHRLNFVYKKTKAIPAKADAISQQAFLDELQKLEECKTEENSVFYYLDGVHPTHNTRSMYVWVEKGKEKYIATNSGRDRVNINGALNADDPSDVVVVESASVNAQSTQLLYEKLLAKNTSKDKIYVICDNATYYKNKDLKAWLKGKKIVPLYLPTYSPNLNLIERLWKFLRKKIIDPVFHKNKEAFRASVLSFFDNIAQYEEELKTLLTKNFHIVQVDCSKGSPLMREARLALLFAILIHCSIAVILSTFGINTFINSINSLRFCLRTC